MLRQASIVYLNLNEQRKIFLYSSDLDMNQFDNLRSRFKLEMTKTNRQNRHEIPNIFKRKVTDIDERIVKIGSRS